MPVVYDQQEKNAIRTALFTIHNTYLRFNSSEKRKKLDEKSVSIFYLL